MYPFDNQHQERHVPRHYVQSVDLDDYIQLQLLLRQERERRQAAIIDRRLQEERQRLEEAMVRLQYIEQQRRQQRLEEERRLQREQRYRAELLAALKSAQGEEYRRRVLAALERQKQWETTRLQHEESVQKQRGIPVREDEARHQALENLLKYAFGQQPLHDDEQHYKVAVPELAGDEGAAWEGYYRPEPRCLRPSSRKVPISFADESLQKQKQQQQKQQKPLELEDHVVPLKTILETLLANPAEQESQQKRQQESADARHQRQQAKQEEDRQQRLVEDRAFDNFLKQIFGQQEQQSSPTPAVAPQLQPSKPDPTPVPKLSEDEAAAKIQTWYKSAHDSHAISQVTHQLTALSEISSQLDRIQSDYEKSILADPTTSSTSGTDQVSTASQSNRRWLQYEDEVMKVLVRLDTIESHGSDLVRERRKQLVKKASALLDRLDEYKQTEFERSTTSSLRSDEDNEGKPRTAEALSEPEPYVVPDLAAEKQSEVVQPKASEPAVSSVPNPVSGHPHPENPNATTVDDEDTSEDAQPEISGLTVGEDVAVETAEPIAASSPAEPAVPKGEPAKKVDREGGKEGEKRKMASEEEFVVV